MPIETRGGNRQERVGQRLALRNGRTSIFCQTLPVT
jgi:hypothetical protein